MTIAAAILEYIEQSADKTASAGSTAAAPARPSATVIEGLLWSTVALGRTERALERAQGGRLAISRLSASLLTLTDTTTLATKFLEGLSEIVGADRGSVMLVDPSGDFLDIVASSGLPEEVRQQKTPVAGSVSGRVVTIGEPALLEGTSGSARHDVSCSMVLPIACRGKAIGVINLNRMLPKKGFDRSDLELAATVVSTFSAMFDSVRNQESTRRLMLSTIQALVRTIEAKDPYTRGHCERVSQHARRIAEAMHLDRTTINEIEVGAALHDVGKIGVPESVLLKPGRLTDEEYSQIKRHPQVGAEIIGPVQLPAVTRSVVVHHHERFDGKGYPDKLAGLDIPLAARIVAVADTFDAMTFARPYREAFAIADAVAEIERCAGTQFDPEVVTAFVACQRGETSVANVRSEDTESLEAVLATPKTIVVPSHITGFRRHPRHNVDWAALIGKNDASSFGTLLDISEQGAFVHPAKDDELPDSGAELDLKFTPPAGAEQPLARRAVVRWKGYSPTHKCAGFGVEFTSPLPDIKSLLS